MAIDRPTLKPLSSPKVESKDLDDVEAKAPNIPSPFDQSGFEKAKGKEKEKDDAQRFVGNKPGQTGKFKPGDDGDDGVEPA